MAGNGKPLTVLRANEKGVVEGSVRYARQSFLVPHDLRAMSPDGGNSAKH